MLKLVLHPVAVSSFDDPETATILLNYSEAIQFIPQEDLMNRVSSQNEEVKRKLRFLVTKQTLLEDFISLNKDDLLFEVYPAEIFARFDLLKSLTIEGHGVGNTSQEIKE